MHLTPILVVEDNPDDWFFLQRAFRKIDAKRAVLWSKNGADALALLLEMKNRDGLPSLVLTDIKMPVMDGLEFLEGMKANPALSGIRAGVFTSSNQKPDVHEAYRLGAEFYIVKPSEFSDLLTIAQAIVELEGKTDFDFSMVKQYIPKSGVGTEAGISPEVSSRFS
jgi:CheY-like chemotaxis protein